MPTFFFGLLFILIFTVLAGRVQDMWPWWPTLPPGLREAVRPYDVASWLPSVQPGSPLDRFLHLLMPVAVLTIFSVAAWSRFLRSSMLEVLRQDYVRTARAKGLVERLVINKHALRNALIPFITILVLQIPDLLCRRHRDRDGLCLAGDGAPLFTMRCNAPTTTSRWPLSTSRRS